MKVTVIGFWGAYPKAGSATSAYLIEKDGFTCLVDCGSGALSRLQLYKKILDIDAVVLSHYHQDHIADIGVLQYSWLVQNMLHETNKILPIYGHKEDEQSFQRLTHHYTKGIPYNPSEPLQVGPLTFSFLKTSHPVPCYGMRITDGERNIVYTADTSYQKEWIPFANQANLLIAECSFYENQDGTKAGHMNSREVGEIASSACVEQVLLSHLPHFGELEQLQKQTEKYYQGKVQLAYEGLIWKS